MVYRVELAPHAERGFKKLSPDVQVRLRPRIDALGDNPRPHGVEKLGGGEDRYRIRVGDYRVVYAIHDAVLLVLVLEVGDRKDIYRRR